MVNLQKFTSSVNSKQKRAPRFQLFSKSLFLELFLFLFYQFPFKLRWWFQSEASIAYCKMYTTNMKFGIFAACRSIEMRYKRKKGNLWIELPRLQFLLPNWKFVHKQKQFDLTRERVSWWCNVACESLRNDDQFCKNVKHVINFIYYLQINLLSLWINEIIECVFDLFMIHCAAFSINIWLRVFSVINKSCLVFNCGGDLIIEIPYTCQLEWCNMYKTWDFCFDFLFTFDFLYFTGSLRTSFLSGSAFNVTWHLAYPHRVSYSIRTWWIITHDNISLKKIRSKQLSKSRWWRKRSQLIYECWKVTLITIYKLSRSRNLHLPLLIANFGVFLLLKLVELIKVNWW